MQILCMIVAFATGNIDQVGNYTEYMVFGLITLAGFMVYNALRSPTAYSHEYEVRDHKSRWRWTFYFLVASVPSSVFAVFFFTFFG